MSQSPFDPVAAWQKMVADWEKQINEASAQLTSTPQFSEVMNQATKYSLAAKQQFDSQMEQFLKTVHLPSRVDVAAIHDRLAAIEEALDRLNEKLASAERPAKPTVARTRRPPPENK
jgi:polyhydroxyalkanoate synthesis regulator phasin